MSCCPALQDKSHVPQEEEFLNPDALQPAKPCSEIFRRKVLQGLACRCVSASRRNFCLWQKISSWGMCTFTCNTSERSVQPTRLFSSLLNIIVRQSVTCSSRLTDEIFAKADPKVWIPSQVSERSPGFHTLITDTIEVPRPQCKLFHEL